ncbi:MAG TPA: hypothetical protein VJ742_09485, partial [Nitrososphaera sp.]|nr:hypothetical protein [Nitrososphaera sp.]
AEVSKELNRDERFTKREGANNFVNVWIRASSLTGRIGRVEPETTEQLPVSWAQKKDAISQLLLSGVPEILAVLTHPNNADLMKNVIGVPEFYIPGEEARIKQLKEFLLLAQGIPVPINPAVDNEEVHIQVLKSILESRGDTLSPEAFQVSMQHLLEHEESLAMKMPPPGEDSEQENPNKEQDNAVS